MKISFPSGDAAISVGTIGLPELSVGTFPFASVIREPVITGFPLSGLLIFIIHGELVPHVFMMPVTYTSPSASAEMLRGVN